MLVPDGAARPEYGVLRGAMDSRAIPYGPVGDCIARCTIIVEETLSRSTVSRETIEASDAALKQLLERRFDELELLIIYIDGMHFGEQCVWPRWMWRAQAHSSSICCM